MKNNKGFTLIELIVTLAIAAILFAWAGSGIVMGLRIFTATDVYDHQAQLLVNIEEVISSRVRLTAQNIYLGDSTQEGEGWQTLDLTPIDSEDTTATGYGRVYLNGEEMFSEGFYRDAQVFGSFSSADDNTAIVMELEARIPDGAVHKRSSTIYLPNYQLQKEKGEKNSLEISGHPSSRMTFYDANSVVEATKP